MVVCKSCTRPVQCPYVKLDICFWHHEHEAMQMFLLRTSTDGPRPSPYTQKIILLWCVEVLELFIATWQIGCCSLVAITTEFFEIGIRYGALGFGLLLFFNSSLLELIIKIRWFGVPSRLGNEELRIQGRRRGRHFCAAIAGVSGSAGYGEMFSKQ